MSKFADPSYVTWALIKEQLYPLLTGSKYSYLDAIEDAVCLELAPEDIPIAKAFLALHSLTCHEGTNSPRGCDVILLPYYARTVPKI